MTTYNLTSVEEATPVTGGGCNTMTYQIPVDTQGNIPIYLNKFRVIKDNQMLVFDTEQEYRTWISENI